MVTSGCLATGKAEGIDRIAAIGRVASVGVIGQQWACRLSIQQYSQTIDRRGKRAHREFGFVRQICSIGISGKVMVEGNVFLKNDDYMLDGRSGGVELSA